MKKIISMLVVLSILATTSLSVFATYVPSIDSKPAPTVVEKTDDEGNAYVAELVDTNGDTVEVVVVGEIVVTSYIEVTELDEEAQVILDEAFDEIITADNLLELTDDVQTVLDEINELRDEESQILTSDLVVKEFFDLHVDDDVKATMLELGLELVITFSTDVSEGDAVVVLHKKSDGEWEAIANDKVIVSDGYVTATFTDFSPVAIVVDSSDYSEDDTSGDTSDDSSEDTSTPQTGDTSNYLMILIISGVALLAIAVLVVLKVKTNKDN